MTGNGIWVGLIPVLIALVAASSAWAGIFFTRRDQAKKDKKQATADQLTHDERIVRLVIEEVTKQRDGALQRVVQLEATVDKLELEIQGMKLIQGRDPFPRWMVDKDGLYMYVNACFEDKFLRPIGKRSHDIIGQQHDAIWPPAFGQKMRQLNELAKSRPDGRAKATLQVNGEIMTVYKLPIRHLNSGAIMGYEGWVTDIEVAASHDLTGGSSNGA